MRLSKSQILLMAVSSLALGQNCSGGFVPLSNVANLSLGSDTSSGYIAQTSRLSNVRYEFDAAAPASLASLAPGKTGIQIDASNNILAIRESIGQELASRGSGALTLVAKGGPNNVPYFHGSTASLNNAYDGLVLPAADARELVENNGAAWTAIFVIRQTGLHPSALLQMNGAANVDIYSGNGTDGSLSIGQNNGTAYGTELSTTYSALNQWQILTAISDGSTLSLYRNGHRTLQTAAGTIGGVKGLISFELLNNPQADVAYIEIALGAPSIVQHDAEVQRLGEEYAINVERVSEGCAVAIAPVAIDLFNDYMTTPVFPETDQPPIDRNSKGPGGGLTLANGSTPIMSMYFPGGPNAVNVPDETTLRKYVYLNYFSGNQTIALGSPMDNGQGDNNTFAAVARHYPLGSAHSTTPVMADGLHMVAFCSQNRTNCRAGNVFGGFLRFTPAIRAGMTVKVRYKAAAGKHAWNPIWLFSGEQRTPGVGGDPYRSGLIDYPQGGHLFEIDSNDNFTRSDDGGAPYGSQLDYGTPDIYGNVWATGKSPHITYLANDGAGYVSHPSAGPPYVGFPNLNWSATFHDFVMNWRNDGSELIDILIDGKVVAQSYMDYDGLKSLNAAGQPLGLTLMIGNQAIPSFSPGASTAIDNDGGQTVGRRSFKRFRSGTGISKTSIVCTQRREARSVESGS